MTAPAIAPGTITRYDIHGADGAYIATKVRRDFIGADGEPDKACHWEPSGVKVSSLPLYGIDKLGSTDSLVYLCEGEKDTDALLAAGLPAVGTVTGSSGTPDRAVLAELSGLRVILWPDNDAVGVDHMRRIAAELERIGVPEVDWIDPWPDAPKGGGAADFLVGRTADDVRALPRRSLPIMASRAELRIVGPGEGTPPPTIGTRTAADLHHGVPPDQLAHPFLTPEGATVLYGRGGVGKGITACWLIHRLVGEGHVVLVLDYEGHEREWGARLRGLGLTDDELSRVHYRAPYGADWTAPTGPLSTVALAVHEDAQRLSATVLVVDSYSMATSTGDTMGGEAAAKEYAAALSVIGLPSLTIAHVRGDAGRFPDKPFGSVHVHNRARETWAVERVGDDDAYDVDPDLMAHGPSIVSLELRNKKSNGRSKAGPQFVSFSFFGDGTITVDTRRTGAALVDLVTAALAGGPLDDKAIVEAIRDDAGEAPSLDAVRKALRRRGDRFVHAAEGKRPRPWALRESYGTTR
jgi:hypothetical protein